MSTVERTQAMQVFSTEGVDYSEETPRFFILCSLHAPGGTGITLNRANLGLYANGYLVRLLWSS